MNVRRCPVCGASMKRNGKTGAGSQRWRCRSCGASATFRIDNSAKRLEEFLRWLMSRSRQADMPGGGRTFRRRTAEFWEIWPMPPKVEAPSRVVYVDAIAIGRARVLIACDDSHVLGWYLARSENSRAYAALMSRIAEPEMVVSDGGSGFERARRRAWPGAEHQRCTVHAARQVVRYTTKRPRTEAGRELLGLAGALPHVTTLKEAEGWRDLFLGWCGRWAGFLAEEAVGEDGRPHLVHERLVKARRSLVRLLNQGALFTHLDPALAAEGPLPATNNRIEGGVNAQIRALLRDHRGMSLERRLKAAFWWCYEHSPNPLPAADILRVMPTDRAIAEVYGRMDERQRLQGTIPQWGDAVVWSELHSEEPYRMDWD